MKQSVLMSIVMASSLVWLAACGKELPESSSTAASLSTEEALVQFDRAEIALSDHATCRFREQKTHEGLSYTRYSVELKCPINERGQPVIDRHSLLSAFIESAKVALGTHLSATQHDLVKSKLDLAQDEMSRIDLKVSYEIAFNLTLEELVRSGCETPFASDTIRCHPRNASEAFTEAEALLRLFKLSEKVRGPYSYFTRDVRAEATRVRELF